MMITCPKRIKEGFASDCTIEEWWSYCAVCGYYLAGEKLKLATSIFTCRRCEQNYTVEGQPDECPVCGCRAMHPFAILGNRSGACGMTAGDRVRYTIDGRTGVADEFLHDGDAFVTWDDGTFDTVKWNHLEPYGIER